jgi:phosphate transport system protein
VMAKRPPMTFLFDYTPMAEKVQAMLKMSLDALVHLDVQLAFNVITMDDEVDAIQVQAYDRIKEALKEFPDRVGYLINLLLVSRHLERLADHSTNIAEEVVYLIEGNIVRHGVRSI